MAEHGVFWRPHDPTNIGVGPCVSSLERLGDPGSPGRGLFGAMLRQGPQRRSYGPGPAEHDGVLSPLGLASQG